MGALVAILGGIVACIGLIVYFAGYSDPGSSSAKIAQILFYPGISCLIIGSWIETRNCFIDIHEKIAEFKMRIKVAQKQYADLAKELTSLLTKYIEYEKGLVDAVTSRAKVDLQVLLERYPDLKANDSVKDIIGKMVELRRFVTNTINDHNSKTQEYNSDSAQWPYGLCRPKGLPERISYIETEETETKAEV